MLSPNRRYNYRWYMVNIISSVHIFQKRLQRYNTQICKIAAVTTPGSLERTFDPGFGGFFEEAA